MSMDVDFWKWELSTCSSIWTRICTSAGCAQPRETKHVTYVRVGRSWLGCVILYCILFVICPTRTISRTTWKSTSVSPTLSLAHFYRKRSSPRLWVSGWLTTTPIMRKWRVVSPSRPSEENESLFKRIYKSSGLSSRRSFLKITPRRISRTH